jgi:ubiquinone/menaquinone biosynthesis C-methylase UbiE/DNA-binding transcriptional ArsR family regulator
LSRHPYFVHKIQGKSHTSVDHDGMLSLMSGTKTSLTAALKLFGDGTRLRMLALLQGEELTVGELTRALDLSQSRVSNHLRLLREAGLLAERHRGTTCHLRLATNPATDDMLARIWQGLDAELEHIPEHSSDLARLARILAERADGQAEFFNQLAGEWDYRAGDFASGGGRTRALLNLFPRSGVFADIGCGTGYMSLPMLGNVNELILVDSSAGMLEVAKQRLDSESRGTSLDFRMGDCTALPIESGKLDGLVAGLLLHHIDDLSLAVSEMFRCLRPGGSAVVLELAPHNQTWMRAELGDLHLGLEPRDVAAAFERAGFVQCGLDAVDDRYRPSSPSGEATDLSMFLFRGTKPA